MKKHIIVLNRVSIKESPYHLWIDTNEYSIILVTSAGVFGSDCTARSSYSEIFEFEDYSKNCNVELCVREIASRLTVHAIVAYSEVDIIRAARCREMLNIAGQRVDSARIYRDKLEMRKLLEHAGMRNPAFREILNPYDLQEFVDTHGFPVIVKPRFGMASIGVRKVSNQSDVESFLAKHLYYEADIPLPYMVESFVEGDIYSVDVVVTENDVVIAEPLKYINTCLNYANATDSTLGLIQVDIDSRIHQQLVDFSKEVIELFSHQGFGTFHIEAFVDRNNDVTLCEAACRVGGGKIPQLVESVHGVNPDEISVRLQASNGKDAKWKSKLIGRKDEVSGFLILSPKSSIEGWKVPEVCPLPYVVEHEVNSQTSSVENVGQFSAIAMMKAGTAEELVQNFVEYENWFYQSS